MQKTDGFMCVVPDQWKKKFGFPLLTGGLHRAQNRTLNSEGPSAFGFYPWQDGQLPPNKTKLRSRGFLWYDLKAPARYKWGDVVHKWKGANTVAGMAFPVSANGERSALIYFARVGLHPTDWYGQAEKFPGPGRPDSSAKGWHAPPYKASAWLYDPKDLLKVDQGKLAPQRVTPYLQIDLSDHLYTPEQRVAAVAYDPQSRRIFVCEAWADPRNEYESWPVIHVFQVS
jgi:hypothetical protein